MFLLLLLRLNICSPPPKSIQPTHLTPPSFERASDERRKEEERRWRARTICFIGVLENQPVLVLSNSSALSDLMPAHLMSGLDTHGRRFRVWGLGFGEGDPSLLTSMLPNSAAKFEQSINCTVLYSALSAASGVLVN